MVNLPVDQMNLALDAVMWPEKLGDPEDGSHEARICVRSYRLCLMSLLRAAHWAFARKTVPLVLLADASGNTPDVGTQVCDFQFVYEYQYPDDCAKARFIPWNLSNQAQVVPPNNISPPNSGSPLMTGIGNQPLLGQRLRPARFVVATDFNYPPPPGTNWWEVQGVSPTGRTVICTNVRFATLVYTAIMLYPSVWDPLFRTAFIAYLASEIAGPIWAKKDVKFGMQVRDKQIEIVKAKVTEARIVDGNEQPATSDLSVDWLRTRNIGGSWRGWGGWGEGGDNGSYACGWDSLALPSGASF